MPFTVTLSYHQEECIVLIFLLSLGVALLVSSIGFKKYVWFISLGYGFSIAAIGIAIWAVYWKSMTVGTVIASALLILYGARLGGYLLYREVKNNAYNDKMKKEIKSGKNMKFGIKCGIWVTAALLYACQTCPVFFRLANAGGTDTVLIIGIVISLFGLIIESLADYQKSATKKKNPKRFVDTGLYKIVRCPNYFGELLIWTGVFIGGVNIYSGIFQWLLAVLGYLGIIYVMFSGARRLELRQDRNYGTDPEYVRYTKSVPIILPFVPIYSVKKYWFLAA